MLSNLATGAALTALLFTSGAEGQTATATFSAANSGVDGYVMVGDGMLYINISIAEFDFNNSDIADGCFDDGAKYHIHQLWDYGDNDDRVGGTPCGATYTSGHWDPWLGCGSATGNGYCDVKTGGCVTGSSVLGSGGYSCNTTNFASNPYSCEVGDWSGKYGLLDFDMDLEGYLAASSPFEVSGDDLIGYSVVFHCTTSGGPRAFCAPFLDSSGTNTRPTQSSNMIAEFDDMGGVALEGDGSVTVGFDIEELTIPEDCGDMLYYRVYNDWSGDDSYYTSGCDGYVGSFYDPTVSCAPGTDQDEFCMDGILCNDTDYSYSCDFENDRFSCAPGDLSGKYGGLDISGDTTMFSISTSDDIMIDLSMLAGKSAVLQCSDTWEIIACAAFESCSDDDCEIEGVSSDDDGAFAASVQFGTIMVVIATIGRLVF